MPFHTKRSQGFLETWQILVWGTKYTNEPDMPAIEEIIKDHKAHVKGLRDQTKETSTRERQNNLSFENGICKWLKQHSCFNQTCFDPGNHDNIYIL